MPPTSPRSGGGRSSCGRCGSNRLLFAHRRGRRDMNEQIRQFLDELDAALGACAQTGEHLDLYHIGRSALVAHYGAVVSTRDFDIIWMREQRLEDRALELFGKGTPNAERLGLYLDA